MSEEQKITVESQSTVSDDEGMKAYFTLGLENPILKYGSWVLFILLVIRLSFVGFAGVIVPEIGERATAYYVAPRSLACEKPNPNYGTLVDKAKREVSPIYVVDNSHLEERQKLLRRVELELVAAVEGLHQLDRQLKGLDRKEKVSERHVKDSPFYKDDNKAVEKVDDTGRTKEERKTLLEDVKQTEENARRLMSTVATGLSPEQLSVLLDTFMKDGNLLKYSFRAAGVSIDECQAWFIVETLDLAFQRDRSEGIVLDKRGDRLAEAQTVYSYLDAVDRVRSKLVVKVITENFPRLTGSKSLAYFVTQIVVATVKANLRKDRNRTEQAMQERLASVPETIAVEFAQGQSIVALGETVEEWQADCIGRFSVKTVGRAGLGNFMGVPVPSLLLFFGIALLVILGSLALRGFSQRIFYDRKLTHGDYLALGVLLVLHLSLVRLFLFGAGVFSLTYPAVSKGTMLTACPVALAVMLISILMGARVAFLSLLFLVLTTSIVVVQSGPELLSGNFSPYYVLYMICVSLAGIWVTRRVARRGGFFVAGTVSAAAGMLFWLIVFLVEGGQVPINHAGQLAVASIASGALAYILLISLAPLFEYLWDYTTDSRLVELSSSEHPALKELSRRAPGTYQHSLWIATLVEEAADTIGANPLLAKVGAYYHDLGKLAAASESGLPGGATDSPLFFAENQAMGNNPHDNLPPVVSARILRKHVELSIKMIRKYRLGKKVEDIAAQHHGTSFMEHFYNKATLAAREDGSKVDDADFRYPGPKPRSKEAALVMLADSVEAAVRALPQHTEENIRKRVQEIVRKRRVDGQLDESTLTFGDVRAIEASFIKTLISMYHARPEYITSRPNDMTVQLRRAVRERDAVLSLDEDTQEIRRRGLAGDDPGEEDDEQ